MITRWRYFSSSVMITRWRYCLSAAMLTRWHYYIDAEMITRRRYCINTVMITRWQYCLIAAMITRWHYCISVEIVIVSKLQRTLDCKKKTSTSSTRRDKPLIRKMGWSTTEREERQMDRNKEKEGGRMQCFFEKG